MINIKNFLITIFLSVSVFCELNDSFQKMIQDQLLSQFLNSSIDSDILKNLDPKFFSKFIDIAIESDIKSFDEILEEIRKNPKNYSDNAEETLSKIKATYTSLKGKDFMKQAQGFLPIIKQIEQFVKDNPAYAQWQEKNMDKILQEKKNAIDGLIEQIKGEKSNCDILN
jgi:hypothetical protein